MIKVTPTRKFSKNYKKYTRRSKKLGKKIDTKIKLFSNNPKHPSLKTHKVSNTVIGKAYSFWIEGDLRILFRWEGENAVVFYRLGRHDELYK